VHRRALQWPLDLRNEADIIDALQRVYRRARRRMSIARAQPSVENLHDWRKQVKYLWHQLQMLEPLRPRKIGEVADQMHKLSDHLGDDHDLAVLRERMQGNSRLFTRTSLQSSLALIDQRRQALQSKAFAVGARALSDSPTAFAAHFEKLLRVRAR